MRQGHREILTICAMAIDQSAAAHPFVLSTHLISPLLRVPNVILVGQPPESIDSRTSASVGT